MFDESNGYYSFCLKKSLAGEYLDSTAYSFVYETTYGTFKPEDLASYSCGANVSIDFCHGVPYQTTDPNALYQYSCMEGQTLFSSDGYGDEEGSIPAEADGAVNSIVLYGLPPIPPTQSCTPAIYTNSNCDAGIPTGDEDWY